MNKYKEEIISLVTKFISSRNYIVREKIQFLNIIIHEFKKPYLYEYDRDIKKWASDISKWEKSFPKISGKAKSVYGFRRMFIKSRVYHMQKIELLDLKNARASLISEIYDIAERYHIKL